MNESNNHTTVLEGYRYLHTFITTPGIYIQYIRDHPSSSSSSSSYSLGSFGSISSPEYKSYEYMYNMNTARFSCQL